MQITHDQAQTLIQRELDLVLNRQQQAALLEHLQDCTECQVYASEMEEVDQLLAPLLKRQWNAEPAPLSMAALLGVRNQKPDPGKLLTTHITAISVMAVALLFSLWQFILSGTPASRPVPIGVPPIPTPSQQRVQSTSTTISFEECQMRIYVVQPDDTLAGIAARFAVAEVELRAANPLFTTAISAGRELKIPICRSTPTGTFDPLTTTFTPPLSPTLTPGG